MDGFFGSFRDGGSTASQKGKTVRTGPSYVELEKMNGPNRFVKSLFTTGFKLEAYPTFLTSRQLGGSYVLTAADGVVV